MMRRDSQPKLPNALRFTLLAIMGLSLAEIVRRQFASGSASPAPPEIPESASAMAEWEIRPPDDSLSTEPGFAIPEESEAERQRWMMEQVYRMREYAGVAGPDDPFALTEEQIREFQKQGCPVIW